MTNLMIINVGYIIIYKSGILEYFPKYINISMTMTN